VGHPSITQGAIIAVLAPLCKPTTTAHSTDKTGLCQPALLQHCLLFYSATQSPQPTDMSQQSGLIPSLVQDTTVKITAHRHATHSATETHPHMDLTLYGALMRVVSAPHGHQQQPTWLNAAVPGLHAFSSRRRRLSCSFSTPVPMPKTSANRAADSAGSSLAAAAAAAHLQQLHFWCCSSYYTTIQCCACSAGLLAHIGWPTHCLTLLASL
jgi:hypothetical protein